MHLFERLTVLKKRNVVLFTVPKIEADSQISAMRSYPPIHLPHRFGDMTRLRTQYFFDLYVIHPIDTRIQNGAVAVLTVLASVIFANEYYLRNSARLTLHISVKRNILQYKLIIHKHAVLSLVHVDAVFYVYVFIFRHFKSAAVIESAGEAVISARFAHYLGHLAFVPELEKALKITAVVLCTKIKGYIVRTLLQNRSDRNCQLGHIEGFGIYDKL